MSRVKNYWQRADLEPGPFLGVVTPGRCFYKMATFEFHLCEMFDVLLTCILKGEIKNQAK